MPAVLFSRLFPLTPHGDRLLYRWCHGMFGLPEPCFTVHCCALLPCPRHLVPPFCKHLASSRLGQRLAPGRPYQTRENQKHRLLSLLQVGRDVRLLLPGTWHLRGTQRPISPPAIRQQSRRFLVANHHSAHAKEIPTVISHAHKSPSCHLACPARPDTQKESRHRSESVEAPLSDLQSDFRVRAYLLSIT
jgi:hypothetical protein